MLRTFITLITCLISIPVQARQLNEQGLLDLVLANDIEAVEQGLRSAHDAYQTGEKGPNHLQKLNSVMRPPAQ